MYGKFFSSTFTGSMYGAGADVFALWGYVIANTVDSTIEINPAMVANIIGSTAEKIEAAIEFLCRPDHKSRNPESGGCRLLHEGNFQYHVVSHVLYRGMRDNEELRAYNRTKQQESRARRKPSADEKRPPRPERLTKMQQTARIGLFVPRKNQDS